MTTRTPVARADLDPASAPTDLAPVSVARVWPLIKFCLVGGVNTAITYLCYLALHPVLPYLAAYVVGWCVGLVASFLMNCWFTYWVRPTWRRFVLFPISSLPNAILSSAGVVALVEWLHVDQRIAPLIATVVAIPFSYLLAKAILLRKPSPRAGKPPSCDKSGSPSRTQQ